MTIWGWWRAWRERRSALREMGRLSELHEATLTGQNLNPLNLAKSCVAIGDLEEAAVHWEQARTLLPNTVVRSPDSIEILLALQHYDEAERLLRDLRRVSPRDRLLPRGQARLAEVRGDMTEALKQWRLARSRMPDLAEGYHGCARCLTALGRLDEADTEMQRALELDPHNLGLLVARAELSDLRKDWPSSLVQWQYVAEVRKHARGFVCAAKAMIELGRIDEAARYLEEPSRSYAKDLEIAVTQAQLANRRGDPRAGSAHWARVRTIDPTISAGYYEGARCLSETDNHSEADLVMQAAIERFPDEAWPLRDFARLAHDRADWDAAAARWSVLRQRFPDDQEAVSWEADALRTADAVRRDA